ncbi:hypothetical protein LCGC14_0987440, partial [marine sediment metagenome]
GGMLPPLALITAQFGFLMFAATAWPLLPSDGMRWISTLFNEPKLLPKAVASFKHLFLGGELPQMIEKRDAMPLALFGIGVLLTSVMLLIGIGLATLIWLEGELGGTGVLFFLGFMGAFTLWLMATWASIKARAGGGGGRSFDPAAFRQMAGGAAAADTLPEADPQADPQTAMPSKAKVIWALIAVALLALAFQPYAYEAGGEVEILPSARGQAVARSDGEILQIMVAQGDMVTRGQILAEMSSWDQTRQVMVTRSMLDGAAANLARLKVGTKPEEVELARRQVASAEADVVFSKAEMERARDLVESGTVSKKSFEKAESNYGSDLAALDVAQANLELVQSGATAEEIAIAQAEVDRLTQELSFVQDELERTRIAAPMDGRVVTADLELRNGSFLRVGETLLEIENSDLVTAAISVPESDIGLIAPGDRVRLKVRGQANLEIDGTVQSIAPSAEDQGYGSVVRVLAVFDNAQGALRSGMTGYAKIDGAQMRVWEAYLRSITRFFQVEVWSWVP